MTRRFPSLDDAQWSRTRDSLHQRARMVGAVPRALAPTDPHWWHIALLPTGRTWATRTMEGEGREFRILADLQAHDLVVSNPVSFDSVPLVTPIRDLVAWLVEAVGDQGRTIDLDPSDFAPDAPYDAGAADQLAAAMESVTAVLHTVAQRIGGDQSPTQLWPHHFDIAMSWFSGRLVPGVDPDDLERAAESVTVGFSFGDEQIPEPYVYATAYPFPDGLRGMDPPGPARCTTTSDGFDGAVITYADARDTGRPADTIAEFLITFHAAAERLMR